MRRNGITRTCQPQHLNLTTGKNVKKPLKAIATAAARQPLSAGDADADLQSVRTVWRKISGECPATELPGSARTAAARTVLETSDLIEIRREAFLRVLLSL